MRIDPCEEPLAARRVPRDDLAARLKSVRGNSEDPLRIAELGVHRQNRFNFSISLGVKIPPIGSIGDEVQRTVGRPAWLEDRFVDAASDLPRFAEGTIFGNWCDV